jgi:Spy/CpxP family protein refolding chaperone
LKKLICFVILLIFPALALGKDLPRGKWWQDPKLSSIIKVSKEEEQKLDELYIESRRNFIKLKSAVEMERFELEVLMEKDPLDEAKVLEQYRKMDNARDSLGTERFGYLLEVRKILGAERFQKLKFEFQKHRRSKKGRQKTGRFKERGEPGPRQID